MGVAMMWWPVSAQPTVIEREGDGGARVDFSGFSSRGAAGGAFYRALRTNLTLHSFFEEAPPSRAGLRVSGGVEAEGGRVVATVRVHDRAGRARFGKRYRAGPDQIDALARAAADDMVEKLTGKPGFATHRIAFIGTRPGETGKEIFSAYPDGGGLIRLTRDRSVKLGLRWAPDGRSLLYTSYHKGFPDIYRHTLQPPRRQALSSESGINSGGTLSPDGRHLAMILSRDGRPELYVKDLRAGRLTRLTRTRMSAKSGPSWSPDGESIVFTSSHQGLPHLYIVSRKGGEPRRITRGGGENVGADWGSNGLIVYTTRQGGGYRIAVLNPRDGKIRIISPADADYEDPSWAPDGIHVVASRTIRGQSELYVLDRAGKQAKALISGRGSWYMPAWSP